jgi:TRAP-type mannitol/chloroaromatic compound transport system permease small subunit
MSTTATPDDANRGFAGDSYGAPLPFGLHHLNRAMNALGTLWILGLMVLINLDVFGRNLLNHPVRGVTEMVSISIVGIVFLQLADTLHVGRFTRADILLDRLKKTNPVLADALMAVFHVVGLALMGVILMASWAPLVESVRIQEYVGAVGDFQLSVWPIRLITLIGLSTTALCFLLLAWIDIGRLRPRLSAGRSR